MLKNFHIHSTPNPIFVDFVIPVLYSGKQIQQGTCVYSIAMFLQAASLYEHWSGSLFSSHQCLLMRALLLAVLLLHFPLQVKTLYIINLSN